MNILGHMQQGASPSPFDRNFGTKCAAKAAEWFFRQLEGNAAPAKEGSQITYNFDNPESAVLLGLVGRQYRFTSVESLKTHTDFK